MKYKHLSFRQLIAHLLQNYDLLFNTEFKNMNNINICDINKGLLGAFAGLFLIILFISFFIVLALSPLNYIFPGLFNEGMAKAAVVCYIVFAAVFIANIFLVMYDKRRYRKLNAVVKEDIKNPSLISLWYKSFREKVCFKVDLTK